MMDNPFVGAGFHAAGWPAFYYCFFIALDFTAGKVSDS
jgi:hypothetical protein